MAISETCDLGRPAMEPLKSHHVDKSPAIRCNNDQKRVDFDRWRPKYHVISSKGWMNDPCAPYYDLRTKLYHTGFQWNSAGNDWDDMCWGHATSSDLVRWKVSPERWLSPSEPYDYLGVFTGSMRETNLNGVQDGTLTCFYTSVKHLPIYWKNKYTYGSETLSLATSNDAGGTWQKHPSNPILAGPPTDYEVVSWRDPFVAPWPSLSRFLGQGGDDALFGAIAGGIRDMTPAIFLYSIQQDDISKWNFLGTLSNLELNKSLSRFSGDIGCNWEVVNFITVVAEDGYSMEVLIVSAQDPKPENLAYSGRVPAHRQIRTQREQLWLAGTFRKPQCDDGPCKSVEMTYDFGGIFDHGCFYAANSFWDPTIKATVVFGWATEDDLSETLRQRQGWSGMLTLPRVLGIQTLNRVSKARHVSLEEITSFHIKQDSTHTYQMRALQIRPHPNFESLRTRANVEQLRHIKLPTNSTEGISNLPSLQLGNSFWEIETQILVRENCTHVGLYLGYCEDYSSRIALYYDSTTATFEIDRSLIPTTDPEICTATEVAPFTLFTLLNPETSREEEESLTIRVFFDGSVLEVFVNDRVAITTRIYADERFYGLKFFAEGGSGLEEDGFAEVLECNVWNVIEST